MSKLKNWPDEITICIPAYNAGESLNYLLPKLTQIVPANKIIVMNDGSNDNTSTVCAINDIKCFDHKINQGKGYVLKKALVYALKNDAKWMISMDADGQHSIDDLPTFIKAIAIYPSTGIIIGNRDKSISKMPLIRIFSNRVTSALLSYFTGSKIEDSQCGYRAYSTNLLKRFNLRFRRFEMETEIIMKTIQAGFSIKFVPIQTLYCSTSSHISHVKDTLRWTYAVFSVWFELKINKNIQFSQR